MATGSRKGKRSAARTMLNVVLAGVFLTFAGLTLAAAVRKANFDAELAIVAHEANALHAAFENYFERHHGYPNGWAGRPFDVTTLAPLANRGYYRGVLLGKLRDRQADAYDSPDDQGLNREFWLEMTLAQDPAIRIVILRSDDAPLSGGRWLEGAYIYRNGGLERL